ncbi:MAG: hypothetical protein KY453_10610 [Gemmatimonadetes bacterium]|nr:hypothetical protein [Gemmatimonadota bacterium]
MAVVVTVAGALAHPASGQERPSAEAPFERLRVEAGALRGLNGDLLGSWGSARGGFLHLALPWGGGELGGRLELVRHPALALEPGDLDEARALVGWAWPLPLSERVDARFGGELGVDYFRLPRPDNPLETEVMAGLLAEAAWRVWGPWRLALGVRRRWTFTEPRLRRDALTAGLGRDLRLPAAGGRLLGGDLPESASPVPTSSATIAPSDIADGPPSIVPAAIGGARWAAVVEDVPGWSTSSVDGVTVRVAPPGAPSAEAARVVVRLDGWEVPLDLLGVTALERLPVEPTSVEGIEVRPGGVAGRPGADAVVDLVSRPLPPGGTMHVSVLGANATGDGGPRALVVEGAPNVESLAWGVAARGGWSSEAVALRTEGAVHRRWVSELPVFARHFAAVDPDVRWPWVEVRRGRVALEADVGPLRHRATLAGSRMDDFFLLPGLPREVPGAASLSTAWLDGRGRLPGAWSLAYGLGRTINTLVVTENRLERELDWRESLSSGRVELRRETGGLALRLERRRVRTGVPLADAADASVVLDGDVSLALGRRDGALRLDLTAAALRDDGRWGGAGSGALVRGTSATVSGLRLSGEAAPPGIRGGLWLQEARGLGLLERWGAGSADRASRLPPLRRISAEAWHRRATDASWVEVRARADRTAGWWLPRADVGVGDGIPFLAGPLGVATDAEGLLGWLDVRYGWSRGPLDGWGSHAVRGVLDGDRVLEEAHETLPRHRSVHHARWLVREDLALTARLEARSGTRHEAFRDAGSLFPAVLSGGAWLDVGARKALLDGRGELELVVRDVLDRELATHPLAGTPGLTLEVLGRVRLGSQPSPGVSSERRRR